MASIILRLPAVTSRTGLSRSTIYLRISQGTFPRPIRLGQRAVGWLESTIEQWIQDCIELHSAQRAEPHKALAA